MASLIPAADRAPSLASRVVTIHSTNITEGAPGPGKYQFSLPCALRVPADDVILQPGSVTVGLTDGRGEVRLPVYSTAVTTTDGSTDWVIVVTPPKGNPYPIRVPSGTSSISLADLPAVRPLTRRESAYAITSVGVTVTEATKAGGTASYANGVLDFKIQVPSFKPSTVYPYIDQTADARAQVYRDEVLDDVDARLAEVTTAYEVAVAQGYTGTITEWLASLIGPRGPVGQVTVNEPAPGVWDIVSAPIDVGVNDVTGLAARLAALEYDTGYRSLTRPSGMTSGLVLIRRVRNEVTVLFEEVQTVDDPSNSFTLYESLIPVGFRPDRNFVFVPTSSRTSTYTGGPFRVASNGQVVIYNNDGKLVNAQLRYSTADARPTPPYPGTAV